MRGLNGIKLRHEIVMLWMVGWVDGRSVEISQNETTLRSSVHRRLSIYQERDRTKTKSECCSVRT